MKGVFLSLSIIRFPILCPFLHGFDSSEVSFLLFFNLAAFEGRLSFLVLVLDTDKHFLDLL
jgi:hypothetical protein